MLLSRTGNGRPHSSIPLCYSKSPALFVINPTIMAITKPQVDSKHPKYRLVKNSLHCSAYIMYS